MPGTIVQDVLAYKLLDAADLTVNADGTAVDVQRPAEVRIEMKIAAVTGTTPTLQVQIQGSDSSTFASGVVSYGRFAQKTAADADTTSYLQVRAYKRFMRTSVIVAGTSPVFNDVTVTVRTPHDRRTASDSA